MTQLSPRAVWLFFLGNLFKFLGYIIAIFIYSAFGLETFLENILYYIIILLPVYLLISYIWARLSYHNYKYELAADAFRKEYGVIFKKYVSIPYDKIQNVDIYRGLLARLMGLSDLHIQTAGSSAVSYYGRRGQAEGRLPALPRDDAEKIRDELIRRSKKKSRG